MRGLKFKFLFIVCISLFGCEDETLDAAYSLKLYWKRTGLTQSVPFVNGGDYEMGLRFKPEADGNLTAFIVRIPEHRSELRVTLWDASSKAVLVSKTIPEVDANIESVYTIDAFPLDKGTEYMLTFNSNDWYSRTRSDNGNITYPVTFQNIEVTGYGYASGAAQAYPTDFPLNYYAGDLSFKFN